ncbi:MAG: twin-arginine translocation protein TatB subunit [Frankiales bacterium]|nr:twin-arginine translocation protein TatB subunit [Frankiales bacterium]
MLGGLGWPEAAVLLLLALFVFGPERLPGIAQDAGRTLRKIRVYLKGMGDDLKSELGPEVGDLDLRSLHPREFVRKHLLEDDDDDPFAMSPGLRVALLPGEPVPWDPDTT